MSLSVTDIRDKLLEVYQNDLGEYVTPNGLTFAAIRIGKVPEDWRIQEGLEINISSYPEMRNNPLYSETQVNAKYEIYFTHDTPHLLTDLVLTMTRIYQDVTIHDMITDPTIDRYQVKIDIPEIYQIV